MKKTPQERAIKKALKKAETKIDRANEPNEKIHHLAIRYIFAKDGATHVELRIRHSKSPGVMGYQFGAELTTYSPHRVYRGPMTKGCGYEKISEAFDLCLPQELKDVLPEVGGRGRTVVEEVLELIANATNKKGAKLLKVEFN